METKFKAGEVVYERVRPSQKLIISNHVGLIYYCRDKQHPNRKHLVFFERELATKSDNGII